MFHTCVKLFQLTPVYVCKNYTYLCIILLRAMSYQENIIMLRVTQKSIKPNNASILTRKKVDFRRNRKKMECKNDQIITAIVGDSIVKEFMDGSFLIIMKKS